MSEEEIIKIIKKELTFFRCTADDIKFKDSIRGLIDLYNKEKEKNKILFDENAHWKASYFKLSRKIDTVSKDKIKEKIKELEKEYNKYTGYKGLEFSRTGLISSQIQVLKELLEE